MIHRDVIIKHHLSRMSFFSILDHSHGKPIASQIKDQDPTSNWNLIKYDVMSEVLMAKINTNPDIKSYLYESGDKQLVEASANDVYWGSGLPFNITVTTTPDKYPVKNMFGKLLSDIRSELRANDIISDNPTPASQGSCHSALP